jgi:hypothetical protein
LPFTQDVNQVSRFLADVRPLNNGNQDSAEDMVGGLLKARDLSWSAATRVLILIADAPCHGRQYHSLDDVFPTGDPSGITPESLLLEFKRNKVLSIYHSHFIIAPVNHCVV